MKQAVVILAGGKSSRMGQNKALLNYRGETFIKSIIHQVEPLGCPIYISGKQRTYETFGLEIIEDQFADQGPVVALSTCFNAIDADNVLVLSCDVPQITTSDLRLLVEAHEGDMTMYESDGRKMPLVAIYNRSSFSHFHTSVQRGERRLFSVLEELKTTVIKYNGVLHNVNTPNDLEKII